MLNQVFDIEELKDKGVSGHFCPYYYAFQAADNYELVFLPYSYLISQKTLKAMRLNLKDSIVIMDEAHNIELNAEEGYSV